MRWTKTWDERKRKVEESEDAITRGRAEDLLADADTTGEAVKAGALPYFSADNASKFSHSQGYSYVDSSHAKDLSMPNIETKSPKKWVGNEGRPSALPSLLPMFTDCLPLFYFYSHAKIII